MIEEENLLLEKIVNDMENNNYTKIDVPTIQIVGHLLLNGTILLKDGEIVTCISPIKVKEGDAVLVYNGKIFRIHEPKKVSISKLLTIEAIPIIIAYIGAITTDYNKFICDWTGKISSPEGWSITDDGKYVSIETGNLHDDPDDYGYVYNGNGLGIPASGSGVASKRQNKTEINYILNGAIEHEVFASYWDYLVGEVPVQYMVMTESLLYYHFKIQPVITDYNQYVEDGIIYSCNNISKFVNGIATIEGIITNNFFDTFTFITSIQKKNFDNSKISMHLQNGIYKPAIVGFNLIPDENKIKLLRSTLRNWKGSIMSDKIQEETYNFENPGEITIGKEYSRVANRLEVFSLDGKETGTYEDPVKHYFIGGSTITKHTETDGSEWYDIVFNFASKYAINGYDCQHGYYSWWECNYSLIVNGNIHSITPYTHNPAIQTELDLYEGFRDSINTRDIALASIIDASGSDPMKLKIQAKPENAYWQSMQASTTACTIADTIHKVIGTISNANIELKIEKNRDFTKYRQSLWCGNSLIEDTEWRDVLFPWSERTVTENGKWTLQEWASSYLNPPIYLMDKNINILHVHVDSKFKCIIYSKTEYIEQLDKDNKQIWTYELLPYRYGRWLNYVGEVPVLTSVYDSGTTYIIGDVVSYGGDYYTCMQSSIGNLPTDTNYWVREKRCYLKDAYYRQGYGQMRRSEFHSITKYYIWVNRKILTLPWNRNNREYYLTGSPLECTNIDYPTIYDSDTIHFNSVATPCWFDIGCDKNGMDLGEDNRHCSRILTSATKNNLLINIDSYRINIRHILERKFWYYNMYTLLPRYIGKDFPPFIDSTDANDKDRFIERKWLLFDIQGNVVDEIIPPSNNRVNGLTIIDPDD
jgi:hypothetical protein